MVALTTTAPIPIARTRDYDRAIADYDQAIRLDPKLTLAYNGRGIVYYDKKDYQHAIADHSQAIKLDPRFAMASRARQGYAAKKDHAIRRLPTSTGQSRWPPKFLAYKAGEAPTWQRRTMTGDRRFRSCHPPRPSGSAAFNRRGSAYFSRKSTSTLPISIGR